MIDRSIHPLSGRNFAAFNNPNEPVSLDLSTRSYKKELLDADGIPFADIRQNMKELNTINTWLGGHAITIEGFLYLLGDKKEISVCEIGCGGGDNLLTIYKYCQKYNITVRLIGIDLNKDCIAVAQEQLPASVTRLMVSDYKQISFAEEKPDIIFSSLFCHHFTGEELVYMLRWMRNNSSTGFFINDLHRHILAYYSIKILTGIFSKSYLVKNDAPLSVLRGFTKKEWQQVLQEAGTSQYLIKWKWAFRWLITSRY